MGSLESSKTTLKIEGGKRETAALLMIEFENGLFARTLRIPRLIIFVAGSLPGFPLLRGRRGLGMMVI